VFLSQSGNRKDGFPVQGSDQKRRPLFEKEILEGALLLSIQESPSAGEEEHLNPLFSFDGVYFGDRYLRSPHIGVIDPRSGILPGDQEADFYRLRMRWGGKEHSEEKKEKADDSQKKRNF
jgi:hypothetical protein